MKNATRRREETKRSRKRRRPWIAHNSLEALLQDRNVVVDQQRKSQLPGGEIADCLRAMNFCKLLNTLQFKNDAAANEQVDPSLADEFALVQDVNGHLALKWNST